MQGLLYILMKCKIIYQFGEFTLQQLRHISLGKEYYSSNSSGSFESFSVYNFAQKSLQTFSWVEFARQMQLIPGSDLLLIGSFCFIDMYNYTTGTFMYRIGSAKPMDGFSYSNGLLAVEFYSSVELFNFQREKIKKGEHLFRKRRIHDK